MSAGTHLVFPNEHSHARAEVNGRLALSKLRETVAEIIPDAADADFDAELQQFPGWDSLNALKTLVTIEKAFNLVLPTELFAHPQSLSSLSRLMSSSKTDTEPSKVSVPSQTYLIRRMAEEIGGLRNFLWPRRQFLCCVTRRIPAFALTSSRTKLLRLAGFEIGPQTTFFGNVKFVGGGDIASRLHVGRGCLIAPDVTFGLDEHIVIANNVSISPYAVLYTASHELGGGSRRMNFKVSAKPIVIRTVSGSG